MDHSFGAVPISKMPRSIFKRTFGHATTHDADYLIPIQYEPSILPGDVYSCKFHVLVRMLSATLKPIMDNLRGSIYTFYVPYRILWDNFKKHMGEQNSPADSISYNIPQVTTPTGAAGGIPIGNLYDYFGVPTEAAGMGGAGVGAQLINNFAGRAYNKVFHDHFRDQNLQNSPQIDTGDGPDVFTNYVLRKINKKFDYITACLPNPQKGATAVTLPLGTSATVKASSTDLLTGAQTAVKWKNSAAGAGLTGTKYLSSMGTNEFQESGTASVGGTGTALYPSNLYADLTNATAATINSLRQAATLQQFLERDARSGTRYNEIVKSHFAGVVVPDFRLNRSEVVHIFDFSINISSVAQTSASGLTGGSTYLGDLTGFGTGVSSGNSFVKSFTEHGCLLSLLVIRGEIKYSQGLERHWSYRTRYDHYWPILSGLGEQAVLNKEVYWNLPDGTAANQKDGVFGYIGRYDEYRAPQRNKLTGLMRPYVTGTLGIWNLSEQFAAQPTLGDTFTQSNTPLDRSITTPSQPHFVSDIVFEVKHARIMPVFSIPGIDRL